MGTEILDLSPQEAEPFSGSVELPAPTAWPIVLAFGLTLVFAGLVTSASVSLLDAILAVAGCVGGLHEGLPEDEQEGEAASDGVTPAVFTRPEVARATW